jgi:hypothetical protein
LFAKEGTHQNKNPGRPMMNYPENRELIADTKLVMEGKASSEYVNLRLL